MDRHGKPKKAKAEAKRPLARPSPNDEDPKVRDLEKRLADALRRETEALEQQRATSDILRVISNSQADLQPVFDAIAASATRLCDGVYSVVFRYDGELITVAADNGRSVDTSSITSSIIRSAYPAPPRRGTIAGRALLERRVIAMTDAQDHRENPDGAERARAIGYRAGLSVPMMRGDVAIGVINVVRVEAVPFTDKQIELLKIFADQAVIAIEHVRLFTELQRKNEALTAAHAQTTEALQQQTATAEILRVVSASPTDVQPVFDAIVRSAVQLCDGVFSIVSRFDGEYIHFGAEYNFSPEALAAYRRWFPRRAADDRLAGRALLEQRVMNVADVTAEFRFVPGQQEQGFRSMIFVPMIRDGVGIGVIGVSRMTVGAFPEQQVKLLQTFADQAVIAVENVRLFTELQERNRALTQAHAQVTESLEQQTATAEILRAISHSPTDTRPAFEAIVQSASRLCDGVDCIAVRFDGDLAHLMARHNPKPGTLDSVASLFPRRPRRDGTTTDRAILERRTVHVADIMADSSYDQEATRAAQLRGILSVPLMRNDEVIGAIGVSRDTPGLFSDRQVALLGVFADQAVIAIENVRLFKELEARNTELTEALEQQTATSEILRVLSASPTDVQPVFDTICRSAVQLLGGYGASVYRFGGNLMYLGAVVSPSPEADARLRGAFPQIPDGEMAPGRSILERRVIQVPDTEIDPSARARETARHFGYRRVLAVPMIRDEDVIGTIAVAGREPGLYSEREIELLKTFAHQAVIAIENVRLFNETKEALEQQTATSEILHVMSRSPTDVQPVFDTIAERAMRLCDANQGIVMRFDGEFMQLAALANFDTKSADAMRRVFPTRPDHGSALGRAVLSKTLAHIPSMLDDPQHTYGDLARQTGFRSVVAVPMLKGDRVIGGVAATRLVAGPFSDREVALLQTFADQAVIAIENVRLFTELQARTEDLTRSVGELTALGEVGRALSSTLDLETVLQTIVARANELAGTAGCNIWEYDETREQFHLRASHYADERDDALLRSGGRVTTIPRGQGVTTRVMENRQPVQIADITTARDYESPIRRPLIEAGHRALLGVPLVSEDEVIGVLTVTRKTSGEFEPEVVRLLSTFATQSALAILNARLFREIENKSRQLEAASRHKSEFLANMSHELRTPLNAVIGFSEVLLQQMFGDLNAKQDEYLKDIYASGQHLLSLINDILDLSKIEAGRMELELTEVHLPTVIDNALILVRERAGRRGIRLGSTLDEKLGAIRADERKVKQVLLNLLSNAIKFTPEAGRIEVLATPTNGGVEISVRDSGVGIAPEDQEAVFEEFRQVGTADKKIEGTGLGLALCRKFVELHGGRIWVKSQVDQGSTFTFALPGAP